MLKNPGCYIGIFVVLVFSALLILPFVFDKNIYEEYLKNWDNTNISTTIPIKDVILLYDGDILNFITYKDTNDLLSPVVQRSVADFIPRKFNNRFLQQQVRILHDAKVGKQYAKISKGKDRGVILFEVHLTENQKAIYFY